MNTPKVQHAVLVTGGSRGIGKAIAERLLRAGYRVVISGKDADPVKRVAEELRSIGSIEGVAFDLADASAIDQFVKTWNQPLYGIVHNAGIVSVERIDEKSDADVWNDVLAVNLHAPYRLTKGLLPFLVDGGRIITISSQLGKEGRAGYGAYCASKFGVIGLTKCWAKELGPRGITANALCPGWVRTEMAVADMERLARERKKTPDVFMQEISQPLELKRFTEPAEVANLVAFLISPEGSGISGRDWLLTTIWNQQ